jgi:sulfite reductase alpha subunit-like flavoprotein
MLVKCIYLILGVVLSIALHAQEIATIDYDTLTISGKYSGKNIFVKNQFSENEGEGFSVQSILLNNEVTVGKYDQSAFEIKLQSSDRKVGDDLTIAIIYMKGRAPKVLNLQVLE